MDKIGMSVTKFFLIHLCLNKSPNGGFWIDVTFMR